MATSRIQQLRLRLAGKALTGAAEIMLPKVQTEMAGVLHDISLKMEDGELSQEERTAIVQELRTLRDDLADVIDLLEKGR